MRFASRLRRNPVPWKPDPMPSTTRRTALFRAALVPAVLAAAGGVGARAAGADRPVAIPMDDRAVRAGGTETVAVARETEAFEAAFPGVASVPPGQLSVVSVPAGGLVESVSVSPDERVSEGQPLLRIRSNDFLEMQRRFLESSTRQALAAEKLRRDEALLRDRVISERRVLVSRAEEEGARQSLAESAQRLELAGMRRAAREELRRTGTLSSSLEVHAPRAGVVMARSVSPGERVPESAALLTIAAVDPLWVSVQVPAERAGLLEPGARVTLRGIPGEGRLLRVGQAVDPATQSVTATAEMRGFDGRLRSGQAVVAAVDLRLGGSGDGNIWRVPSAAVARRGDRNWVFVRTAGGFEARPVSVISEGAERAVVRGALLEGDRVASRNVLPLISALARREEN